MRLDQYLAKRKRCSERTAREHIAAGRVRLDEQPVVSHLQSVTKFSRVHFDEAVLQEGEHRTYVMMNKALGVVSATRDAQHKTVLDEITIPQRASLHLAGRLDRSSSGLVLLSNDGRWTQAITNPESHLEKVYLVETDREIPEEATARFEEGFHFLPEDLITLPALLEPLGKQRARVTLFEGRYHQVKRMFHKLGGIRLRSLHRERIGGLALPEDLGVGEWRHLTREEQTLVFSGSLPRPIPRSGEERESE